jgi:hypothetical protein
MPIVSSSLQTGKIVSFVSAEEFYSWGAIYMRPGRSQTGMNIEIVNMFTWDQYENHKIFNLFPLPVFFLVDGFC